MTPSEVLMDALTNEDPDTVDQVLVIFKREDGFVGYRTGGRDADQSFFDTLALINFARLSVEHDLQEHWRCS